MKRVYVAGAYSAPTILGVRKNMRMGLELSVAVLKAGFAPFCPWLDFEFGLLADLPIETYYAYSMAWLMASDAVIVQPVGADASVGTQAELSVARDMNIPIFYSLDDLIAWRDLEEE